MSKSRQQASIAQRVRAKSVWVWLLGGVLAAWLAVPAHSAAADLGATIDAAGRQRMLTQRIVKAYCEVGLKLTPDASRAQLASAVQQFDTQLDALERAATDADTRRAVSRQRELWAAFRQLAGAPVSRDGARQLAAAGEELLGAAQQVVERFEKAAGTAPARLVNLSGRQRMLSQRLAKLYMLRAWQIDGSVAPDELDAARREFESALATLRKAPENTRAIATELDAVAMQWEWFKSALTLQGTDSYVIVVSQASESILASMDLVTARYAAITR